MGRRMSGAGGSRVGWGGLGWSGVGGEVGLLGLGNRFKRSFIVIMQDLALQAEVRKRKKK